MTKKNPRNPSGFSRTGRIKALQEERRVKAAKWDAVCALIDQTEKHHYGPARSVEEAARVALLAALPVDLVRVIDEQVHPDRTGPFQWANGFWRNWVGTYQAVVTLNDGLRSFVREKYDEYKQAKGIS